MSTERRADDAAARVANRHLTGYVKRWELLPFLIAIVAIFVAGIVATNSIADQRVDDIEIEAGENREIIKTLVRAICDEAETTEERGEIRLRSLVEALVAQSSAETKANVRAVLDSTALPTAKCLAAVTLAIDLADDPAPTSTDAAS